MTESQPTIFHCPFCQGTHTLTTTTHDFCEKLLAWMLQVLEPSV